MHEGVVADLQGLRADLTDDILVLALDSSLKGSALERKKQIKVLLQPIVLIGVLFIKTQDK